MPTAGQFRGGTGTQNDAFTGLQREISIDTSNNSIRVHNSTTPGGFQTARSDLSNVTNSDFLNKVISAGVNTSGATGPTGPAGVINGTPYQLAFYGTNGSSTGSSTFAVNTNPTANAILLASPTAGVDTGVNFGVPGASASITFNGTNLRLVYNGVDKLYANGPLVTSPGSFQVNGTTYLSGATQTQQVQSTSITSIGDIIAQGSFIQPLSSVGNNWTSGTTATVTTNAGTANISPAAGVVDFTLTNAGWNTASGQCILFIQQTEPENTNGGVFQYLIDPVPPNSFRVRKTFTDGGAKTVFWQAIRGV
jgi:hypothetical protein